MKVILSILSLIFLFFLLHTVFILYFPLETEEVIIEIPQGESAKSIANKLYQNGIIRSADWFYFYVRLTQKSKNLSFGKYLFKGKNNLASVVQQINHGKVVLKKVTIPEGYSLRKTIHLLHNKKLGSERIFLECCTDSTLIFDLTGLHILSLEGFLYPETYYFPEEASEKFIVSHLVNSFYKQIENVNFVTDTNLSFYEILILASIVEKEAKKTKEKPRIASVYLNRIKHGGYKLQADPTVAYVLEKQGKRRKKIYFRDLEVDSPYNTYKYEGLPPTPICSPSLSSIKAVLEPEETEYYFFFADQTGGHIFTKTYSEHLKEQKIMRAKNGR